MDGVGSISKRPILEKNKHCHFKNMGYTGDPSIFLTPCDSLRKIAWFEKQRNESRSKMVSASKKESPKGTTHQPYDLVLITQSIYEQTSLTAQTQRYHIPNHQIPIE